MKFFKNLFNNKMLGQQPYVDETGNNIPAKDNKKLYIIIGLVCLIIIITVIIFIVTNNNAKNSKCNNIESMLKDAGYKYAESKGTLPSIISDPVTYDASELIQNGYISSKDFAINNTTCDGTVKITNIGDSYVETINITNCNFCTTDTKYGTNWSTESDNKPNSGVYDVVIYYNYTTKTTYHTEWTGLYTPDQLQDNPVVNYKDTRLKSIPTDAKNIIIDHEDTTYYRYRDQKWKYYQVQNSNYSALSCTQPSGYATKDTNTYHQTDWTYWSLEAPAELDCIQKESKTGYRWYKVVDGKNVYWNNGAYSPTNPDSENESYTQDKKDSATVWRYRENQYRWYNGNPRKYSGYQSTPSGSYIYRDDELSTYGNWSSWSTTSSLNGSNNYYRTEETQIRTRYRLTYDEYSFNLLDSYLTKADFESKVGKTLADVNNDPGYAVVIQYKYIYRKK